MNTRRIFTFLLIAAVCLMSVGVGAADVLTVGNSGSEMYASIQDAIDEANEGDTIEVFSGTYYENVNVNKQLTLRGIGMPVVDAGDGGSAITLRNDGIILEGFTAAEGNHYQAGILVRSNNNTLINNTASNSYYGISLSSSNNNTLINNTASDNIHYGISLSSSSNNTLIGNTASNNININSFDSNSGNGIYLSNSRNNMLSGNIASNNSNSGIYLYSSSNNTLSGNIASNNLYGIYLYLSSNNTLSGNTASNNSNTGISLASSSNNTLSGNTASNNSKYGIYLLFSSSNNTLSDNIVSNNSNSGISLASSSNNTLISNIAFNNSIIGIRVSSSSNNTLSGNTASNSDYGIYMSSSSNNTLIGNTASNNKHGIYLLSSSNNMLSGNTASNNSNSGIWLFSSSSNNTLIGNTASDNRYTGIWLYSSSHNNTLMNNIASDNTDGILLYSLNNMLISNTAANNSNGGIYLYSSSNNTLSGNIVPNNKYGIWLFFSSSNNTLSGNTAFNNRYGIFLSSFSHNNTLSGNTASNSVASGILLGSSGDNMLSGNIASNNGNGGIYLSSSSNNMLSGNIASNNGNGGIVLSSSSHNTLSDNIAFKNSNYGIWSPSSSSNNTFIDNTASNNTYGIFLASSSNSTLSGNTASNNTYGIYLSSPSNNTLSGNTASNNTYGISLYMSNNNNNIYHNNLVDNTNNAKDNSNNQWDSGTEGNHYSDYLGTDSDGDGIGDIPYLIPGGSSSVDRYPLMGPYSSTTPSEIQDKTLYQEAGQAEVYWFQNNKLYEVTDNVIEDMSGIPGWGSVNTLPASKFDPADYEQGPRFITTDAISDGLLIREVEDYKVYLVENGMKRHITYPDVMDLKGYSFDDVIEVSSVISDMFQFGDPIGIEVDLYFNKITNSGDISHVSQFISEETVKSITETTVVEDYTVNTYVKVIFPDNTEKYAYYVNSNPQPTDSLQFSDSKISLYPDTWVAQTNTWNWNEYTFAGDEMEGIYTWEFWYEDVASGKILGMDVQGYEFTNTIIIPSGTPVESSTDEGIVYFDVGTGTIEDLIAENVGAYPDAPVEANLKYGLFSFNIIDLVDGSTTLTFEFPDNLPAGTTYWKYGPTPADSTPHWYSIPSIINGNKLTITLTDGGLGDDDLAINGIIADPGGPSIPLITAPIPEFPTIALPVLSVIGLMLLFGRRRDNL